MDFQPHLRKMQSREALDDEMLEISLFLYDNPFISRKTVDDILLKINNFISNFFIPHLQNEIVSELHSSISQTSLEKMKFILNNNKDLFTKFSTEHHRLNTYASKNLYIPPELIEISPKKVAENSADTEAHDVGKVAYVAHVSIENSLKKILEIPGMYNEMLQYADQLSKDNVLCNIIQGDLWAKKYSSSLKTVFPLFIYFDEFETRDPLKSHAGKQKLGGVYGSLACLPPHLIGKSHNVFLISVFYAKYLKMFGNDAVFRSSINNMNTISTKGIKISIDKTEKTLYFECILILGDNVGLNAICGFSKSFVAKKYCRICTATNKECQCMLVENEKLIRTVDDYNDAVLKRDFEVIGISEPCIFNKMSKFHIVENVTLDVMHDLCEGIAGYTVSKVLQFLIETKVITLEQINNRIERFDYGSVEIDNKPQTLFFTTGKSGGAKIKIKQSASELLCLTRYLGVMIGDIIPSNNQAWKLYIYLRRIVGILTSPTLNRGQMVNLTETISKHNKYYFKLCGKLKPKMHLLTHYPRVMLLNGPAIHYSSMKFERKNRKLKEVAIGTTSNVNLPLTIAIRNQLQLSYASLTLQNLKTDVELGQVRCEGLKKILRHQSKEVSVKSLKYIIILGKKYSTGSTCITKFTDEGPEFGLIEDIICDSKSIYFQTKILTVEYFNQHYYAYKVVLKNSLSELINTNVIPRTSPCLLIKDRDLIVTRYDL